jgi:hypothetical protein
MSDTPANPALLCSLGRLARGLSALFWGLPATLIICAETARVDSLTPAGLLPALIANGLLLFGLRQMSDFHKTERPWRNALDRAKIPGLINLGLSPFLFWFNRMPEELYFRVIASLLILSGILFLANLNLVLRQLGAMLPDETLREETRQFTALNRWLLLGWVLAGIAAVFGPPFFHLSEHMDIKILFWLQRILTAVLLFLGLAPLAITMALVWKAKEVILDSVFGARN